MTENPYAPSHAAVQTTFHPGSFEPVSISGMKVMRTAFRMMADRFWPLTGIGTLWFLVRAMAEQSGFGIIAVPHLVGGLAFTGYRTYQGRGKLEHLFDGFQKFGPVLIAGLIYFAAILALLIPIGGAIFGYIAFLVNKKDSLTGTGGYGEIAVAGFVLSGLAFVLLYANSYLKARWILVLPLITYFDHDVSNAFKHSWQATAKCGKVVALQFLLFEYVFPTIGLLLFCVGMFPAFGLLISFHGAVCGFLLDQIYPETRIEGLSSTPEGFSTAPGPRPIQTASADPIVPGTSVTDVPSDHKPGTANPYDS